MYKIKKAINEPSNKEPVSPKKTFLFGLKLYARNPTTAPATAGTTSSISFEETESIAPMTKKNFKDNKEATPSIPSIRFKEFTTTINIKRLTTTLIVYGSSSIPKIPWKESIIYPLWSRTIPAKTCKKNFSLYFKLKRSSPTPINAIKQKQSKAYKLISISPVAFPTP